MDKNLDLGDSKEVKEYIASLQCSDW